MGRDGGEMSPPDSGELVDEIGAEAWQFVPTFQFQIHPWIPVSIVFVISPPLVSPHPETLRFHTHDDGAGVTGCAGAGVGAGLGSGCGAGADGSGCGVGAEEIGRAHV